MAAREGYVHTVRYLVQKHADKYIEDDEGVSMRLLRISDAGLSLNWLHSHSPKKALSVFTVCTYTTN